MKRRSISAVLAAGVWVCLAPGAVPALAQAWPSQTVRIISPFPAGGGPDVITRMVAERLGAKWKQPVVIDARPGGNGFLAVGAVKRAAPTGYDLLMAAPGNLSVAPALFKNLPYDPKADFVPIATFYRNSFFILVAANSPIQTSRDLVTMAAASPGKITYGSTAVGGPLHLGATQIEAVSGTKMVHVPYKEISQLYLAVSTGEVDWALGSLGSASALLKAGKVRVVAVADNVRAPASPNVPTFLENGGPKNVTARSWLAVLAPKGTPKTVVDKINSDVNEILKQPEIVEKLAVFGFEPYPQTPAALTSLIASEMVFYADMVRRTGATAE